MTTNVQSTRPSSRPGDPAVVETTPTPIASPVGGVAVYDRDETTDSSLRPSASMVDDRVPAGVNSSGSMLTWIISAIVLIVLVYLLITFVF
jgi:hypothetical protein